MPIKMKHVLECVFCRSVQRVGRVSRVDVKLPICAGVYEDWLIFHLTCRKRHADPERKISLNHRQDALRAYRLGIDGSQMEDCVWLHSRNNVNSRIKTSLSTWMLSGGRIGCKRW